MRRIRILILAAAACVAALAVASNASAGDFADGPCTGEPAKLCPTATVGQSYSVEFTLKEPGDCVPDLRRELGGLPPGLSLASDEGVARGTPTQAGSYTFYITVSYTCGTGGKDGVFSDQQFTINVNRRGAAELVVATPSLPDANLNQAYTAPALHGLG